MNEVVQNLAERLWVEKYRPKTLDDLVLSDDVKQKVQEWLREKHVPHLLLAGVPGTGKTTLARILVSNIIKDSSDFLKLNASLHRGIDVVRKKIEPFVKTKSLHSPMKIVLFEEFDNATLETQLALRELIEAFSKNVSFIFTCNYLYSIAEPIRSRCQVFQFNALPREKVLERVFHILQNENVEYDPEDVEYVVDALYPKLRDIIQTLQKHVVDGKLVINREEILNVEKYIKQMIKQLATEKIDYQTCLRYTRDIINLASNNYVDYVGIVKELYMDPDIPYPIAVLFAEYADKIKKSMVPDMVFVDMIHKMVALKEKVPL